jgi:hypothetical protein
MLEKHYGLLCDKSLDVKSMIDLVKETLVKILKVCCVASKMDTDGDDQNYITKETEDVRGCASLQIEYKELFQCLLKYND